MDLKEILTTHREYLHQIPELGFCEFKTSAYLKEQLELLGYKVESTAKTGLLAYRKGESDECIAFRSDMDGLSLAEETGVAFTSKHQGKCMDVVMMVTWLFYLDLRLIYQRLNR